MSNTEKENNNNNNTDRSPLTEKDKSGRNQVGEEQLENLSAQNPGYEVSEQYRHSIEEQVSNVAAEQINQETNNDMIQEHPTLKDSPYFSGITPSQTGDPQINQMTLEKLQSMPENQLTFQMRQALEQALRHQKALSKTDTPTLTAPVA